jgi:hypothetical protein
MQALAVEKLVGGSNDLISREQAIPRHIRHLKSGLSSRGVDHRDRIRLRPKRNMKLHWPVNLRSTTSA